MATKKSHVGYRDSETGQMVKESYAKKHPKTTEKQHIANPGRGVSGRGGKRK
jgi:hypothetical protein